MLAAKHFDPVMGVDIHMVTIPPTGPVPIPHPHISSVLDPMDYVPVFGGTVYVGGVPRATAGTAGTTIPHIPLGGPFPKPVGNEDEVFMGSATVKADDAPFTFTALPSLSCQDVGMIAPIRAKKPKKSYGMLLPLSNVISIPAGLPVLVGGPPTIDIVGLAMAGAFAALGALAKKLRSLQKGSKRIKKISDAIHKKANKIMDKLGVPPNIRNKIHKGICAVTGHPVDVVTGKLMADFIDFELPGDIPFRWLRTWFSTSTYVGSLGNGWHHNYDTRLIEEGRAVAIRMEDGRGIAFPALREGEISFNRQEELKLFRQNNDYYLEDKEGLIKIFRRLAPTESQFLLIKIKRLDLDSKINFYYSPDLYLSKVVDSSDRIITFHYEEFLKKICVGSHNGTESQVLVTYGYEESNLTTIRDAMSCVSKLEYQSNLLVKETNKNGLSFYFEYDKSGIDAKCLRTWGDGGLYYRELIYEDTQTVVTDSCGARTTYIHNGVLPTIIIDPYSNRSEITYNNFYQITCLKNNNGAAIHFQYDERGNLLTQTFPDSTEKNFTYNEKDRLIEFTNEIGAKWTWDYDETQRIRRYRDPTGNELHYFYKDSKLTKIRNQFSAETHYRYDTAGNLVDKIDPNGARYSWKFDWLGNLIAESDPNHSITYHRYNLMGRRIESKIPDGNHLHFFYDAEGNLIYANDKFESLKLDYIGLGKIAAVSHGNSSIKFEYDKEERLIAFSETLNTSHHYHLGLKGEVLQEIDSMGRKTEFVYDVEQQLSELHRTDGSTVKYGYDTRGRTTSIVYDDLREEFTYRADGYLLEARNNHSKVCYKRDMAGRVLEELQGAESVALNYDLEGRITKVFSSLGADQEISYDIAGNMSRVKYHGTWIESREYDHQGNLLKRSLPCNLTCNWNFDKVGRPVLQKISSDTRELLAKAYHWGVNDRLLETKVASGDSIRFEYNSNGNPVTESSDGGLSQVRVIDALGNCYGNHAMNDRVYDSCGALLHGVLDHNREFINRLDSLGRVKEKIIDRNSKHLTWNSAGHLSAYRDNNCSVSYKYDALGRRIEKVVGNTVTQYLWAGDSLLHEWQSDPVNDSENHSMITWYSEPGRFSVLAKVQNNQFYSIVSNNSDAPIYAFDADGHEVWGAKYNLWGAASVTKGKNNFVPFRKPGQYLDVETGFYYNRFRYFDPDFGLYLSPDPLGKSGANPTDYAYVSNPLIENDCMGLMPSWMPTRRGYQRHHMIPQSLKNHPAFVASGLDIDSATNMKYLPVAPGIDPNPNKSIHKGWNSTHQQYNDIMRDELNKIERMAKRQNWDQKRIQSAIHDLQHATRANLSNGKLKCG